MPIHGFVVEHMPWIPCDVGLFTIPVIPPSTWSQRPTTTDMISKLDVDIELQKIGGRRDVDLKRLQKYRNAADHGWDD